MSGTLPAAILGVLVAVAGASPATQRSIIDARDGERYGVVVIGGQQWLAQNARHALPGSWCFKDDPDDCAVHGRLYTWEGAVKACPLGWHLPSDHDWRQLEMALGMSAAQAAATGPRGTDQGARLRTGGTSVFAAAMSGYRRPNGEYARRGERVAYWTSTEANDEDAWHRDIRPDVDTIYRSPVTKTYALSVRCLRAPAVSQEGTCSVGALLVAHHRAPHSFHRCAGEHVGRTQPPFPGM